MGLFSTFTNYFVGKKQPTRGAAGTASLPEYEPSKYDEPSGKILFKEYSQRAEGKEGGFAPEDLTHMRGEAIDQSVRVGNELERRGMAGRRFTGGATTGGMSRLREKAILSTQLVRSQALRDVSIRNAMLKHEDRWKGIRGLHEFQQTEREEARWKTGAKRERTKYQNLVERYKEDVSYATRMQKWQNKADFASGLAQTGDQILDAILAHYTGGASVAAGAATKGGTGQGNYREIAQLSPKRDPLKSKYSQFF